MLKLNYVLNPLDHLQIPAFIEDDLITGKVNRLEIWKPAETLLMAFFHREVIFQSGSVTLCCFSSVTHGFLIKTPGLLL